MKKLSAYLFLFSATVFSASAQKKLNAKPKIEEWSENPKIHVVPPEYANEHAIIILNDEQLDFRHETNGINVYRTIHRVIKVLDHEGMEQFNEVHIPHWYAKRIPMIKARTILPNGKVKDIAKDMILTTVNASGNYEVRIAMEGVEKYAEIEYLVKEAYPSSLSDNVYLQYPIPVELSNFEMSYPNDLTFEMKSYNGTPAAKEYAAGNRKHLKVTMTDVPALRREPFSFYNLHRMKAEYRIADFATDYDKTQELNWDSLASALHNRNYNITEKERKAVNGFLTDIGVTPGDNELQRIEKIEDGIKRNITLYAAVDYDERKEVFATRNFRSISLYDVAYSERREVLDTIITKKASTESGYIKLFAACLTQAGVEHQVGLGTNHQEYLLDRKFPNLNELDFPLIYFPNQAKYIAPLEIYLRYPFIPYQTAGGKGLFSIIPPYKRKGDLTTGLYEIRTVKPLSVGETQTNVTANVNFTKDMDAQMDVAYAYKGYEAIDIRTRLAILKDKALTDYVESLVKAADKREDVLKYTLSNEGFDKYHKNKPLELYASVTTSRLTEKAGPKYIFRVGALVASDLELYAETNRNMPVDLPYPSSATHKITVNIPKGYKVTNLEALRMEEDFLNNKLESVMAFKSDYKIEDDQLIITVSEYYNQMHFPISEYERFRKVVNRAADFSKTKIVFEKGRMPAKPKAKKKVAA